MKAFKYAIAISLLLHLDIIRPYKIKVHCENILKTILHTYYKNFNQSRKKVPKVAVS